MEKKLAIVIPAYKSKYLAETLEALTIQTNQNFNCFIADDASPENLENPVEKFKSNLPINYKRFSDNLGEHSLPGQWSRSISLSGSEPWIWLLCDDDLPGPTCVEEFYKAMDLLDEEAINVFRFATLVINGEGVPQGAYFIQPVRETGAAFIARKLEGLTRSSLSEYIFRRSSYLQHGFVEFPLGWHTDDAAWVAYSNPGNIYTSNDAIVAVRISDDSISGQVQNVEKKFTASVQFIEWLRKSEFIERTGLSQHTWLYAYYGIESYYVNKYKKLTLRAFLQLWRIRMNCVGFWESMKIMKVLKILFVSRK